VPRRRRKITIRVVHLRRLIPLSSIRELPGVTPRSIEVRGNRMDLASMVEVNGQTAVDFAPLDASRLLVTLPASFRGSVTEIAVLSDSLDQGGKSLAYYDLGTHPRRSDGKYRILQRFVKLLLTTPGSDVWSPSSGGGMQQLAATVIDPQSESAVSGEVQSRVMNVTGQIVRAQTQDYTVPMAERLLNAVVNGILFSTATQSLNVRVTLSFQDGGFLASDIGW
jgi:hypothetical protein